MMDFGEATQIASKLIKDAYQSAILNDYEQAMQQLYKARQAIDQAHISIVRKWNEQRAKQFNKPLGYNIDDYPEHVAHDRDGG